MVTVVASRFAVLGIYDDDDDDNGNNSMYPSKKRSISNKKPVVNRLSTLPVKNEKTTKKKKRKKEYHQPSNSNNSVKLSNNNKAHKNRKENTCKKEEETKEKDNYLVQNNSEEDLNRAILLSKLDYEKKKDYYETVKMLNENQKKSSLGNIKQKSSAVLSECNETDSKCSVNYSELSKTDKIKGKTKHHKEFDISKNKEVPTADFLGENNSNEFISQESLKLVMYQASLEMKDREIAELRAETEKLKNLLKNVKIRNAKLCQIIANGEMKDKAEVLMEVERLQAIKDELSSEVATLHILLEQERSKVCQLTSEHKYKEKMKKQMNQ